MKTKKVYPGTEAVLYMIVQLVCNLCLKQLTEFTDFKKKYTAEYVATILKNLSVAKALPDYNSRRGKQTSVRKQLEKQNMGICRYFQKLLRYIEDGFEEDQLEPMRQAAGGDLYEEAKGNNWKASTDLQEAMILFMKDYADELAEGGMPDNFADTFEEMSAAFAARLIVLNTSRTSSGQVTTDKIGVNNKLYKQIMGVMDDGKEIFVEQPDMVNQFSYRWLVRKLGRTGNTGFRFSLKVADTLVPVQTASVSFLPSGLDFSIEDDETGVLPVYLPELKPGESYNYILTAPGYKELAGVLVATTGVMHRVDLLLKKETMSAVPGKDEKVG